MGTLVIGTTDSKTKWTQTLKKKSSLEEFNNEAATSRFARELLIKYLRKRQYFTTAKKNDTEKGEFFCRLKPWPSR